MKKLILSVGFVLAFSGYALAQNIVISDNLITSENISASTITINDERILDLATNNNSIFASSINIGNDATLIVGLGSVNSSIRGSSDNVGNVKFNADNELLGNVGTTTTSLSLVEIGSEANLITATRNIDANQIILNDGAILNYGSGTIIGGVEAKLQGVGKFIFNNTKTTSFAIGQNNYLSQIDVINGATITLGGNIAANTINIGSGTSGKIRSNGKNITANNINLFRGATLEIDALSFVDGEINGSENNSGTLQFSGSNPIDIKSSIGQINSLEQILISNESTLNLNDNFHLNSSNINIGEGSVGDVGIPILNQNNGIIGTDENSLIRLNTDAVFNYNGGIINGIIRGTSSSKGTFNINNDYVSNNKIGQSFSLANLNIANGATLTANSDIAANNIVVRGVLNLGNSSKIITGNLVAQSGGIIDFGSANHSIVGNFSTNSGDILKLKAINNSNIGKISASGNIDIEDGTNLVISFNSDDGYFSDGERINIISGSSGSVDLISGERIDVNNSGSNKSGIFTFRTENLQSNLFLVVDRDDVSNFTSDKTAQLIYEAVDKAGSGAKGELRNLQKLIDNQITNNSSRESALQSVIPQSNNQLNNSAINSALLVTDVVNSRIDNVLLDHETRNFSNHFVNNKFRNFNFDDEVFDDQAIWFQGFNSSATKDGLSGYDYDSQGIAIGVDQEIAKNLRIGVSSSFSDSKVVASGANHKQTNINSYQFNLYGGYVFDPYFVIAIAGVAVNKYSAIRSMQDMNLNAKADYGGQTYIAKIESGINKKFSSGFFVIPKLGLIMAKNQIATYSENGAGTLNLTISNEHNNFLEGRFGVDFGYDDLEIYELKFKPKFKLSYGYNFLAKDQSSKNNFENQNNMFVISSPAEDKSNLRYGLGFDLYDNEEILFSAEYDTETRKNYKAENSSVYVRYRF